MLLRVCGKFVPQVYAHPRWGVCGGGLRPLPCYASSQNHMSVVVAMWPPAARHWSCSCGSGIPLP